MPRERTFRLYDMWKWLRAHLGHPEKEKHARSMHVDGHSKKATQILLRGSNARPGRGGGGGTALQLAKPCAKPDPPEQKKAASPILIFQFVRLLQLLSPLPRSWAKKRNNTPPYLQQNDRPKVCLLPRAIALIRCPVSPGQALSVSPPSCLEVALHR